MKNAKDWYVQPTKGEQKMPATRYKVKRCAKINLGNYENTDIHVEIEEDALISRDDISPEVAEQNHLAALLERADKALANKIDAIELREMKAKSKASRFGV